MDGSPRYLLGKDEDSNIYSVRTATPYMVVRFASPTQAPNPTRAFVWPESAIRTPDETQFLVGEHYRQFSKIIFQLSAEKTVFEIVPFGAASDYGTTPKEVELLPKYVVCTPALNEGSHWVLAPEHGILWEVSPEGYPTVKLLRELKLGESGGPLPAELKSRAVYAAATIR